MQEKLVFTNQDGIVVNPQLEIDKYSAIIVEHNAINFGLSREVSERLLNEAKKEVLLAEGATNDHFLFNQKATRIVLGYLSKTSGIVQKIIIKWGGTQEYLNNLPKDEKPTS